MKGMVIGREEYGQTQNLAVVHLNPENILKRMNFRFANPADEPTERQSQARNRKEAS